MQARTAVCYPKALESKVKLGLKTSLEITDNYLLLCNTQEYLNDLETAEKAQEMLILLQIQTCQNASPSKLQAAQLL